MKRFCALKVFFFIYILPFSGHAFSIPTIPKLHLPHVTKPKAQYTLDLGTFKTEKDARTFRNKVASEQGIPVQIKRDHKALYTVYAGPTGDVRKLRALKSKYVSTSPKKSAWPNAFGHALGKVKKPKAQSKETLYTLDLGTYKVEKNANAYRNKMASKLDMPVHIKKTDNALYVVYVGPSDDVRKLQAIRHKYVLAPTKTKKSVSPRLPKHFGVLKYEIKDVSKFISFNIGPAFTEPGFTQTLLLWPETQNTYLSTGDTDTVGFIEVFFGGTRHFNKGYDAALGLSLLGSTNMNPEGDVLIASSPQFNNFFYSYKINHSHIALKGKLSSETFFHVPSVQPYVSGSVGVGFNYAYQFGMTPKLFEAVTPPLFQPNTETSFIYTVGIGLQKPLNNHWLIGAGYTFSDWGQSKLAAAPEQTLTGHGLTLNRLYVNAIELGFTYRPK